MHLSRSFSCFSATKARSDECVLSFLNYTIHSDPNVDLGGNKWKPDSEKMGATDVGDFFPEGEFLCSSVVSPVYSPARVRGEVFDATTVKPERISLTFLLPLLLP